MESLGDFNKYVDKHLLDPNDGWRQVTITVTGADVPELGDRTVAFPFHYMDMDVFLKEQFGKAGYKGHFALEFQLLKNELGRRWGTTGVCRADACV